VQKKNFVWRISGLKNQHTSYTWVHCKYMSHREVSGHTPAKVTQFEYSCVWVHQEILWLDVSMADALGMNIRQTAK